MSTASPSKSTASKVPKAQYHKHTRSLESIRSFLRSKSCYDILPESFRLVVLDNQLSIKKALIALLNNGVVSAPLVDSHSGRYAGMFTLSDIIHLIQYYYKLQASWEAADNDVETFILARLREIEAKLEVPPPTQHFLAPDETLYSACETIARTHARRIPLIDRDSHTGREIILSVLTQYRMLKFVSINCSQDCARLNQSIASLGIGTYITSYLLANSSSPSSTVSLPSSPSPSPSNPSSSQPTLEDRFHPLAISTPSTSIFSLVHLFSSRGISAVPIVDPSTGVVMSMYETHDVIDLVSGAHYKVLDLTVGEALERRQKEPGAGGRQGAGGVVCCSPDERLGAVLELVRERRVHRIMIVEDGDEDGSEVQGQGQLQDEEWPARRKGRLVGILALSDILSYLVGKPNLKGVEKFPPPPHAAHPNANASGSGGVLPASGSSAATVKQGGRPRASSFASATTAAGEWDDDDEETGAEAGRSSVEEGTGQAKEAGNKT